MGVRTLSLTLDKITPPNRGAVIQQELKESIKDKGILEPILCRKIAAGKYKILDGLQRYVIAKEVGLKTIPVRVA